MKATIFYKCTSYTEAVDKSNLYYINISAAHDIKKERGFIKILNKRGHEIAVFQY